MNKIFQLSLLLLCFSNSGKALGTNNLLEIIDTTSVAQLDEVVVVAQPKEIFHLRQQPMSSTTFGAKQMKDLGLSDLRQLSSYVPSFSMPQYGSRLTSSMYIRGIGSRLNSPAMSVYIDGMPVINKAAFNVYIYDLERVDVLRGPQGTLYGQNTEGGLLRMYSVNPMRQQGTKVKLSLGTYGYRLVEGAHHQRIGEKVAFSLAGFYRGQDGFFRNTALGTHADKSNEAGGRLRFIAALGRQWELDFQTQYQYSNENAFPYGIVTGSETAEPAQNRQSNYRRNMLTSALTISHKNQYYDFSSTTSYQYLRDFMLMDQDYLPLDMMHLEQRQHQTALTQEFTFKGNANFWHWTAGMFGSYQWLKTNAPAYFHEDFNQFMASNIRTGLINQMVPAFMQARQMTYEEAYAFLQTMVQMNQVNMYDVPGRFRTPSMNLGFYHESNFDITPRLVATLGLRYDLNHEAIRYESAAAMLVDMTVMRQQVASTISSQMSGSSHDTFRQLLPKFGLRYTIDSALSDVYVNVSKGYRAGGFNMQLFGDLLQYELQRNTASARSGTDVTVEHSAEDYQNINESIRFKPEESWNYEIGAHLNLFGGKLQSDFSAYLMRIRNQQLSVMAGNYNYGRMMVNAGKSQSLGFEVALRGVALANKLRWSANYSFTHATFRNYQNGETSYKGKRVPFVPAHSFALTTDYRLFGASGNSSTILPSLSSLTIGADLTGRGKIYWEETNQYAQKFYMQLGAHINAQFKKLDVRLWGRNLTNTHYNSFAVLSGASGQTLCLAQQSNPVQFGVDIEWNF